MGRDSQPLEGASWACQHQAGACKGLVGRSYSPSLEAAAGGSWLGQWGSAEGQVGVRLCPRELQVGGGWAQHRSSVRAGPRGLSSVAETKQPFPASDPLSPAPHLTHEVGKGGEGGVRWYICLECFPVSHPDRWGFQDLRTVAWRRLPLPQ